MAWLAENVRGTRTLDDYASAALTTGTNKREWVVTRAGRIVGVRLNSGGTGTGAGSSTIDVNINGTTIFTTQANRPTIATASTGDWTVLSPDGNVAVREGDVISYDVDAIPATAGHTRTAIAIDIEHA